MKKKYNIDKYKEWSEELQSEDFNKDDYTRIPNHNMIYEERLKFTICTFLIKFQNHLALNNKEFSIILNKDEPTVSRLRNYRLDRLSSKQMFEFVEILSKYDPKDEKLK